MSSRQQLIESLESRTLLAGASVAGAVLRVYGDRVAANVITVNNNTDGTAIDVSIAWTDSAGAPQTFNASFLKSRGYRKINIFGGKGADVIDVAQTNGSIAPLKVRIEAGQNNDTITTGDEQDQIFAGRGNDVVHCGGGNDLAYGGLGNDQLFGEEGNDALWGGRGQDTVDGGNGNDKLGGVLGAPNEMTGGAGQDTFIVQNLTNNPVNDYNSAEDILVTRRRTGAQAGTGTEADIDAPEGVTI